MKTIKKSVSDFIGFRSAELSARLRAIAAENPTHKGLLSALIVAAVTEKLDRMERGEDQGIRLTLPVPVVIKPTKSQLASAASGLSERRRAH